MPMAKAWRASRQYVHLKPVDQKENCDWRKSEQEVPSLDRSRDRLRVRDDKREKRDEPQDIHRPRRSERLARALPQFFRRPVMATEHHAQRADEKRAHHGPAHHDFPRQGERRRCALRRTNMLSATATTISARSEMDAAANAIDMRLWCGQRPPFRARHAGRGGVSGLEVNRQHLKGFDSRAVFIGKPAARAVANQAGSASGPA